MFFQWGHTKGFRLLVPFTAPLSTHGATILWDHPSLLRLFVSYLCADIVQLQSRWLFRNGTTPVSRSVGQRRERAHCKSSSSKQLLANNVHCQINNRHHTVCAFIVVEDTVFTHTHMLWAIKPIMQLLLVCLWASKSQPPFINRHWYTCCHSHSGRVEFAEMEREGSPQQEIVLHTVFLF